MIKIRMVSETHAMYMGENRNFEFSRQSSESAVKYTLNKGTLIELDRGALPRNVALIPGDPYIVDGVWFNFTKKPQPEMVLCATKIYT